MSTATLTDVWQPMESYLASAAASSSGLASSNESYGNLVIYSPVPRSHAVGSVSKSSDFGKLLLLSLLMTFTLATFCSHRDRQGLRSLFVIASIEEYILRQAVMRTLSSVHQRF
jgi:hypothetical protein